MAAKRDSENIKVLNGLSKPGDESASNDVEVSRMLKEKILRLKAAFMSDDGRQVDYEGLKKSEAFKAYENNTGLLHNVVLEEMDEDEKKTFFINIYNALTLHSLAAQDQLPSSVLKIPNFWRMSAYKIGKFVFTLDDIEHGILRGNSPHCSETHPFFPEDDDRVKLAMTAIDPRIHFALNCGAKSCPPIAAYSKEKINEQLDLAAKAFLRHEVTVNVEKKSVTLSKILFWYQKDFGKTEIEVLRWLKPFMDVDVQDQLDTLLENTVSNELDVTYSPYDWNLNSVD